MDVVVNFMPWPIYSQEEPVPIEHNAGWAPEPVWMFWWREKSLTPAHIQTWGYPVHSLVAILTTLLDTKILCPCKIYYTSWKYLYEKWQSDDSIRWS
jgi:hypothetical protein